MDETRSAPSGRDKPDKTEKEKGRNRERPRKRKTITPTNTHRETVKERINRVNDVVVLCITPTDTEAY
jgi:hypothetical protein